MESLVKSIGQLCQGEPQALVYAALATFLGEMAAADEGTTDEEFDELMAIVTEVAREAFEDRLESV